MMEAVVYIIICIPTPTAGLMFYGFREARIRFPPTYRWQKGAVVEDYGDMVDLARAYTADKRIPSWTDRILVHSLADRCVIQLHHNFISPDEATCHEQKEGPR